MATAREGHAGAGVQATGLAFAGKTTTNSDATEEYTLTATVRSVDTT